QVGEGRVRRRDRGPFSIGGGLGSGGRQLVPEGGRDSLVILVSTVDLGAQEADLLVQVRVAPAVVLGPTPVLVEGPGESFDLLPLPPLRLNVGRLGRVPPGLQGGDPTGLLLGLP